MVTLAALIGFALGWFTSRRDARRMDRAHRAGVFAIICGAITLLVLVIVSRYNA